MNTTTTSSYHNHHISNNNHDNPTKATKSLSGVKSMKTTHKQKIVLRCKVVVIGDATVGKTALCQMLYQEGPGHNFPKNYVMTAGVDFGVKSIDIKNDERNDTSVELYMFDCGGQSIFNQREFGSMYYENASAFVIMYDVMNRESFKSCAKWIKEAAAASMDHKLFGVLIGNKIDCREEEIADNNNDDNSGSTSSRYVTTTEGEELAATYGDSLAFFETSALNSTGIKDPFMHIAKNFNQKYQLAVENADQHQN